MNSSSQWNDGKQLRLVVSLKKEPRVTGIEPMPSKGKKGLPLRHHHGPKFGYYVLMGIDFKGFKG